MCFIILKIGLKFIVKWQIWKMQLPAWKVSNNAKDPGYAFSFETWKNVEHFWKTTGKYNNIESRELYLFDKNRTILNKNAFQKDAYRPLIDRIL